jgi:hypothetical protein
MQLESVGRIFDEHRRQDILMIEERDEIQRSYQEENEDYQECIWMYDSNLCREVLKYGSVRSCITFILTHSTLQPQHDGCDNSHTHFICKHYCTHS